MKLYEIHTNFLINLDHIVRIDKQTHTSYYILSLSDGTHVEVSWETLQEIRKHD